MMGHAALDRPRMPGHRPTRASGAGPTARRTSCGCTGASRTTGACTCAPPGRRGRHQLAATAAANALAVLPDGDGRRGRRRRRCPAGSRSLGDRDQRRVTDLVDPHGRTVRDLRISVTDRCNFRCTYCMPAEGMTVAAPRASCSPSRRSSASPAWPSSASASTGSGSPGGAHRPGPPDRCSSSAWPSCGCGVARGAKPDLSMTTNGATLRLLADDLRAAGLDRVNISLDSLRRRAVLGHHPPRRAGPGPRRHRSRPGGRVRAGEAQRRARAGRERRRDRRLRHLRPPSRASRCASSSSCRSTPSGAWDRSRGRHPGTRSWRPSSAVLPARAGAGPGRGAGRPLALPSTAPARWASSRSVTAPFCGDCDRVRLTAEGQFRTCLFATREFDLRAPAARRGRRRRRGRRDRAGGGHQVGRATRSARSASCAPTAA